MSGLRLCECGCGNPTPIAKRTTRGYRKGEPQRYLLGHTGPRRIQPVEDRFMSKVIWNGDEDECWTWEAARTRNGYGRFPLEGKNEYAHRVAYEMFAGRIPEGLHIDHLCRNRACVNPNHLEPVTPRENFLRGETCARATHCPKGHAYAGDNLYISPKGHRNCRACSAESRRRYRQKRQTRSAGQ